MLIIKKLYFSHNKATILKGISFRALRGEITTILGPNGSGKTTLFKCIAGIWKPIKGNIVWDGKKINDLSLKERARIFSIVPQDHRPSFSYSVLDVVITGRVSYLSRFSSPKDSDYQIAKNSLKKLGIYHLKNRSYTKISGGERQLVLIARALTQNSPIMLLDEPISHLDFNNQIKILRLIKKLSRERNISIVMSLHDPNLAMNFSDRVIIIKNGVKLKEGHPDRVITEETIREIYGVDVIILSFYGKKAIIPMEGKNVFDNNLAKLLQHAS